MNETLVTNKSPIKDMANASLNGGLQFFLVVLDCFCPFNFGFYGFHIINKSAYIQFFKLVIRQFLFLCRAWHTKMSNKKPKSNFTPFLFLPNLANSLHFHVCKTHFSNRLHRMTGRKKRREGNFPGFKMHSIFFLNFGDYLHSPKVASKKYCNEFSSIKMFFWGECKKGVEISASHTLSDLLICTTQKKP